MSEEKPTVRTPPQYQKAMSAKKTLLADMLLGLADEMGAPACTDGKPHVWERVDDHELVHEVPGAKITTKVTGIRCSRCAVIASVSIGA